MTEQLKPIKDMGDAELMDELVTGTTLRARIRKIFYHGAAMLEQKDAQPKPPHTIMRRRMEFEIAEKIIAEAGMTEPVKRAQTDTERFEAQSREFDAVTALSKAWAVLSLVPIVDDDYPAVRAVYEGCMRDLVKAMWGNGRI